MITADSMCVYPIFFPLEGSYNDRGTPVMEVEVLGFDKPMRLSVFAEGEKLRFARLVIEGVDEGEPIPEVMREPIDRMLQALLSVLRLTVGQVKWDKVVMSSYPRAGATGGLDCAAQVREGPSMPIDWDAIKGIFTSLDKHGARLLGMFEHGINTEIPVQFRFLSLYLMIEVIYRKRKKWLANERDEFLEDFRAEFPGVQSGETVYTYLNRIRLMCAHAHVGLEDDDGAHILNLQGLARIQQAMVGIQRVALKILSNHTSLVFETPSETGDWSGAVVKLPH